ncbi:response regulator transcription factor [Novibacillus thermophilus]|uniref:DNA-binding response regulator n=1 Tax=Novibacillus thermophilus TaxID=1471761 RepID=A0A1U9KBT6_9BACL|nr:response regulator transcription factor [Novibacillus thermophilus]AQS57476.1 DNA-binding response regulator [Novibacillus thermophilus]
MQAHILVIEDDQHIQEMLKYTLESETYRVSSAFSGREGMDLFEQMTPDLVLLDIMLPDLDGWEVLERIRLRGSTPVIMLTAKGEVEDKIKGLNLGSDDYITKPFSPGELLARIRAVLRRVEPESKKVMSWPNLTIHRDERLVKAKGQPVTLTRKEFDLLLYLATHKGQVISREHLLSKIWDYAYLGDTRTVDTHVKRLREKLESRTAPYRYIRTVWGSGYTFEVMRDEEV